MQLVPAAASANAPSAWIPSCRVPLLPSSPRDLPTSTKCWQSVSQNVQGILEKLSTKLNWKFTKKKWLWCFFPSISDHLLQLSLEAWKQPFTWQRKELLMAFNPRSTVKLEAQLPTKPGWCYIPWSAGNLTDHESWWMFIVIEKQCLFKMFPSTFFYQRCGAWSTWSWTTILSLKMYHYCQLLVTSPWMHTPWALFCMAAFTCHYCHLSPTRWRLDGRCFFRGWGVLQWKHAWFHRFSFKNVDGDRYVHIIQAIHNMMKLYL